MILGIISDTHDIDDLVIKYIVAEFKKRGVETIIHCGDIEIQHLAPNLFGGIPVVCALNAEQLEKSGFKIPPEGWQFTIPDHRIRDIEHTRCYIGHKFSFNLLIGPEASFKEKLNLKRKESDGLRWVFAGHTHHQIFVQTQLVNFVNPGAVQLSPDGYEFAIVDTKTNQVIFSRVPKTKYLEKPFTVGILPDSLNISQLDATFWQKLAKEFRDRDVRDIIHCGNISTSDIGLEELRDFQVHYRLRPDQLNPRTVPDNWHLIPNNPPIVVVNERKFYIHDSLARTILQSSEAEMHRECLMISEKHPELSFILYGNTNDAYLAEEMDGRTITLNPGDARDSRNFVTACLPRCEITFGIVPLDPLPPLEEE